MPARMVVNSPQSRWATWANLLTLIRLGTIPAAALSILFADWAIACALFVLAVISDLADGYLARAFNQQSSLGGLLDHGTDALYVAVNCWALASSGFLTPWLAPLILAAFTQYMLDSSALQGQPLRASMLGRNNGVAYYVVTGTALGYLLLQTWLPWIALLSHVVTLAGWLLVITTLLSMGDRAWTLIQSRR